MSDAAPADRQLRRGPATVVISHRIAAGRDVEYRRWQDEITAAATTFPGYLGTEVTPTTTEDGEATVIYRFDTVEHLNAWLTSAIRERLTSGGAELFATEPTQQVLVGSHDTATVATVVVSHRVRPADEAEFVSWQGRMTEAERRFPGFAGSELFRPVAGVQEDWIAVYRYASADDMDRWLESDERRTLLREGQRFQDYDLRKITNSFGSWFSFGANGETVAEPPSWKTALSVLVGLYPTVVLLTLAISALWKGAPLWSSLLVGNILSVSLLTWVVMPIVTRALRFWLAPARTAVQPRTDVLGTVAGVAFLAVAAFVFWLVTVVIWTLP